MSCCVFQVKLVEVLGRRTLMLFGLGGMFIFYAVMTIAFCYSVSSSHYLLITYGSPHEEAHNAIKSSSNASQYPISL